MQLNLNIKNFGKLEDAEIRIGSFTVLAGPNNTGKSYVSKLLYSLFNAMNANHADVALDEMVRPILSELRVLSQRIESPLNEVQSPDINADIQEMRNRIKAMKRIAAACSDDNSEYEDEFEALDNLYPGLVENAEEIKNLHNKIEQKADAINQKIKKISEKEIKPGGGFGTSRIPTTSLASMLSPQESYLDCSRLEQNVGRLCERIRRAPPGDFIQLGMGSKIHQNLIENFQTPNLSLLIKNQDKETAIIKIEGVGQFMFVDDGGMGFSIEPAGLQLLQEYSRVIYLESPVYWKIKGALLKAPGISRFSGRSNRKTLTGVPGYFYDLLDALGETYSGDVAFPDLLDKLTGKEILGGRISISDVGDLIFQENNHSFPLPLTAMGVTNLGILALLIERKVIDKNSFVFIDEPEAHLHPAWQIAITEILFELSRQGVNIVIATHSADILKWLEVHIKKHPEDEKLVTLNQFPANDYDDEEDFSLKIAKIKEELTKPFADLYMAGL